ncbi:hypothetical protein [Paenibacillus graminis]|uniref:Uncharacterized protein n=1 Tax=Paenibacillus graminis TaxID=189425 RepID=A0A089MAC4_9BACL|nr:hypothetical protein [Paenibacillus graminis]AIQ70232.1 hypothetical protein PGRAT_23200 [Paenibacillus graminis]
MIGFQDRLVFENKSNDLLAVGELLIDMISNEYDDTFQSAGYMKRAKRRGMPLMTAHPAGRTCTQCGSEAWPSFLSTREK